MPRAFVAVDLEPVDRLALHALQRQLGGNATRGWLAADDLHLTLRFFGDIHATDVGAIAAGCAALAAITPASSVTPETLEAWPPQRAQVLVLALNVEPSLLALQQGVQALPAATPRENRPWRPHITLRRARIDASPVMPAAPLSAAPIACDRIALFARAEVGGPARYQRIAAWPLLAG